MLWGPRSWEDIYKVQKHSLETKGDANKELNQFISNRHPIRASLWTKYRSFVTLLRLSGTEGSIGG